MMIIYERHQININGSLRKSIRKKYQNPSQVQKKMKKKVSKFRPHKKIIIPSTQTESIKSKYSIKHHRYCI